MPRLCAVQNCPYRRTLPPGGFLHLFPTFEPQRGLWKALSGLSDSCDPSHYGICSSHFNFGDYKEELAQKKKLLPFAIPTLNLPMINPAGFSFGLLETRHLALDLHNKDKELNRRIRQEEERIAENKQTAKVLKSLEILQQDNDKKQRKIESLNESYNKEKNAQEPRNAKVVKNTIHELFGNIFTTNQLNMLIDKKSKTWWNHEDMSKAMSIYNCSSACYVLLREKFNFPLPGKRTVQRWMSKINIRRGIVEPVMRMLKEECKDSTPMQRQVVLAFDECSIDSRISIDEKTQTIIGPFKNIMGVYVRGLFYNYKQLIYYDFDAKLDKAMINHIVSRVHEVGLEVIAMVCDMSTCNVRIWNLLGVNYREGPFSFAHPVTQNPIWLIADFCHVIKLLRNHFIDYGLKLGLEFGEIIIDKSIISNLIKIPKDDLKVPFKLSNKHIFMTKRQKMNVRTAFQIFSRTTAEAIRMQFPDLGQVADFFQLINDGCDLFNTRSKILNGPNICKKPFGVNIAEQMDVLNRFEKAICETKVQGGRGSIKPFQRGMKLTCGSLRGLYEEMSKPPVSCHYIMTAHLNQDFVESSFGSFRDIGGTNDLPLPTDAENRIKSLIISWNIRNPKTGNTNSEDSTEFVSSRRLDLLMGTEEQQIPQLIHMEPKEPLQERFAHISPNILPLIPFLSSVSQDERSRLSGAEHVAGFIASKFLTQYPELKSEQSYVGWISRISEGNLTSPSLMWLKTFLKFEEYFASFHKHRYTNSWQLNREPHVFDSLSEYLETTFLHIPPKAIQFYVKLRTRIRVKAINAKITQQRKERRSRAFINSLITLQNQQEEAEGERGEEQQVEEELEEGTIQEINEEAAIYETEFSSDNFNEDPDYEEEEVDSYSN